jgi:hypothetical protein
MLELILKKPVVVVMKTDRHKTISGFFEYFHAPSRQVYIKDFMVWVSGEDENMKIPQIKGEIIIIPEENIEYILLNHKVIK